MAYTPDVAPSVDPSGGNVLLSRRMGTVLGCACLLICILFDQLWMGTLAFGIGFAIIFGLLVFYEKSKVWYQSIYLYASLDCLILPYLEYTYNFLSNLMKVG